MKIAYLGSGKFGLDCLGAMAQAGHELVLIVTNKPHPAGRGRKPTPTAIASWANEKSITLIETDNINNPQTIKWIAAREPDLTVVIAFGQKISNELISLPKYGTINVHASLLPKYRGAAPINHSIIDGETETGVSIMSVVEKMDAGPVCAQAKTEILPGETAGELHDRLAKLAGPLLTETIEKIAQGSTNFAIQDNSKATAAPKLKKSDGFLDFSQPAETIERKVRGLWPWPEASANYILKETEKCRRVIIAEAKVVKTENPEKLGTGMLDENLNIICGKDALQITKIKPAGGRLMNFADFVNGWQCKSGDLFGKIEK